MYYYIETDISKVKSYMYICDTCNSYCNTVYMGQQPYHPVAQDWLPIKAKQG